MSSSQVSRPPPPAGDSFRTSGASGVWRWNRLVIVPHEFSRLGLPDRLFYLYILLRPAARSAKIAQSLRGGQ